MQPHVQRWFDARTFAGTGASVADRRACAPARARAPVSVVLPALNEQQTVGTIVATIRRDLMDAADPLVDELVVLDSGSTDATAAVAAASRVPASSIVDDVLADLPSVPGKGEALWRSLCRDQRRHHRLRRCRPAGVLGVAPSPGCWHRCSPTRRSPWSRPPTTGRWPTAPGPPGGRRARHRARGPAAAQPALAGARRVRAAARR